VLRSRTRDVDNDLELVPEGTTGYIAAVSGHTARRQRRDSHSVSLDSGKSDAMIIKRTDHWAVQYDSSEPTAQSSVQSEGEHLDEER
jgi:hypothetical protein